MLSSFTVDTFVSHAKSLSIIATSITILICLKEFFFIGLEMPWEFPFIQSKIIVIKAEYLHVISIIQLFCPINLLFCPTIEVIYPLLFELLMHQFIFVMTHEYFYDTIFILNDFTSFH